MEIVQPDHTSASLFTMMQSSTVVSVLINFSLNITIHLRGILTATPVNHPLGNGSSYYIIRPSWVIEDRELKTPIT